MTALLRFAGNGSFYGNALTGMRLAIEGGADVNELDGNPLLQAAMQDRYGKMVARLLKYKADPNLGLRRTGFSPLMGAVQNRLVVNARALLAYKADPNAPAVVFDPTIWRAKDTVGPAGFDLRNATTRGGRMLPLSVAARLGDVKMVALLLSRRAKVEGKDPGSGLTALHHAAEADKPEVARLLLKAGAKRSTKDGRGRTPLAAAGGFRATKVVRLLKG